MSRIWLTTACAVVLAFSARPVPGAGPTLLEANPTEAHLSMRGPVSVAGIAPLPIADLPVGEYELRAEGPGLPAARGRLVLAPSGISRRAWAGPATLVLPPGVVHLERGETRGWTLLGAGIGAATMAVVSQTRIGNAEDDVDRAQLAYDWAVSDESITDARSALLAATQERDDHQEVRTLWLAYLGATWLGASLENLLLTPQPSLDSPAAGQYLITVPRANGARAALRSALVPGGGQRYMGRHGRANFFFTATAAFAAASIAAHDAFLEARRDQDQAQRRFDAVEHPDELDRARHDLEEAADRVDDKNTLRWALVGATAGVYAWNVLDALGLGQNATIPGLSWSVAPGSGGLLVCATWSMP